MAIDTIQTCKTCGESLEGTGEQFYCHAHRALKAACEAWADGDLEDAGDLAHQALSLHDARTRRGAVETPGYGELAGFEVSAMRTMTTTAAAR